MGKGTKKTVIRFAMITGLLGVVAGLYFFYRRQVALAWAYCYKISDVKFKKISKGHLLFDIFVKVQNKSNFQVDFMGYDFKVYINGKQVSEIKQVDNPTTLEHKGITEFQVPVDFSPEKLFNVMDAIVLISYIMSDKSKFIIQVVGDVTVKMNFVKKTVPFNIKYSLSEILQYGQDAMDYFKPSTSKPSGTKEETKTVTSGARTGAEAGVQTYTKSNPPRSSDPITKCDIK